MATEVRRLAAMGCHAVTFSGEPGEARPAQLPQPHWDPFWTACADEGTVICLHLGSSSEVTITSLEAPITTMITLQPVGLLNAAADLMWSPVPREFPVTIALSEGGIGWVPYLLERADYVFEHHRTWTGRTSAASARATSSGSTSSPASSTTPPACDARPHRGREHLLGARLPAQRLPWPTAPESLAKSLGGVPRAESTSHDPRQRLPGLPVRPFAHRPGRPFRDRRRAAAGPHVDTAPVASGRPFEAPPSPSA